MSEHAQTAQRVSGKRIARYLLLPEIFPRAKALGGSGFGYLAFLIACVYQAVRILPKGHPYTLPSNIGTFGIRQAIAAAANHITLTRRNIDQVVIFFAVIAAVVLLAMQFLSLLFLIFSGEAFASGATGGDFEGIFETQKPAQDIAFLLLDYVFGIPDFFGSNALADGPTPFHLALQTLFQFYNLAILIVAVVIFLYFVIVVVAETALSGTPFGKRFNTVYAPLRLVFAIGLLVPLNHGLNASQYITLAAARAGSGMATNGWIIFNRDLTNPMGLENKQLVAEPNAPENIAFDQFMTVAHACKTAYQLVHIDGIDGMDIKPYIVASDQILDFESVDYATAKEKFKNGNIRLVFGERGSTDEHKMYGSSTDGEGVKPYCGAMNISLSSQNPNVLTSEEGEGGGEAGEGDGEAFGPEGIQQQYYRIVQFMWEREILRKIGERFAYGYALGKDKNSCIHSEGSYDMESIAIGLGDADSCKKQIAPPSSVKQTILDSTRSIMEATIKSEVTKSRGAANFKISEEVLNRGWGGAGIWYNQIAELNGAMVDATQDVPSVAKWPLLMEEVLAFKTSDDGATEPCERFSPNLSTAMPRLAGGAQAEYVLTASNAAYSYWYCDNTTEDKGLTANIFWDAMHIVFGTNGLFGLRQNNADEVHPLASLTAVGKSLVESSIRNMAYSLGTAALGGALGALAPHWGAPMQAMSKFFVSVAMIALTAGFILYYILPFLPFIYFFFAVGAWIKTIFEAMVGAPLWALAHLRIDGEGFPGRSAANGYFLIFEIFVRPILTLFGLLGGMAIFTAMAVILNDLFSFVVFQITGTELSDGSAGTDAGSVYAGDYDNFRRAIVDEFFYTVLYAILLYMIGLASFKMIDLVPNNILRWMGAGVSSFADQAGDPKEGLVQYAALGGYKIGGDILGATNQLAGGVGSALGGLGKIGQPPPAGQGGQTP